MLVIFLFKIKKLKNKAFQGAAPANLGIAVEVALFCFNINAETYFIGALIGGDCGGYWLGMTKLQLIH